MSYLAVKDFYIDLVQDNFYPYWRTFEDLEYGGVLNCIDNRGIQLLSDDKFTWSQGRYLWVLSKLIELSRLGVIAKLDNQHLQEHAKKTYCFIKNHAIYEDAQCYYLLSKEGEPKEDPISKEYDASIFADCFALIGMAQYVRVEDVLSEVDTVRNLYRSIKRRIENGNFKTEPYPIPQGYVNHSIPMIMLNTTYEFMLMLEHYAIDLEEHRDYLKHLTDRIFNEFRNEGLIREFVSDEESKDVKLLDRHINPGHTIEDLWFIIESTLRFGEIDGYIDDIALTFKKTFNVGWDNEFGGLLRFVDKDGGSPKGSLDESSYTSLIQNTHDMKLWWPHSEALYLPLLLNKLTGEKEYMEVYQKVHNYVFDTFPNQEVGEWIQIRQRDGAPVDKVVALPVKDPFHILRNFIKIIEL